LNNRDDVVDAFRYAMESLNLAREYTFWQKIKRWFKKLFAWLWFKFNKKRMAKILYLNAINSKSFRIRNIMGNLYSEYLNHKEVK
jgi:hypothetical protein